METRRGTSLIDIREFLKAEGARVEPWAAPETAVDRLYDLLEDRARDERFWLRLKGLVSRLDDRRFDASRLDRGELLGGATLDRLLDDLQHGVAARGPRSGPVRRWLGSALSSSAMLGFLLLGAAVGCDDGGGDAGPRTCEEDVEQFAIPADEQAVYCELFDIIQGSSLSESDKADLLDCLPGIDATWREWMLEYLQEATAEEIAEYLETMLDPCNECGEWTDDCDAH